MREDLTRKIDDDPATQVVLAPALSILVPPLAMRMNGASQNELERTRVKRAVERIRGQLRTLDAETGKLEREIARRFHPYWGSLLKEAHETSSFGDQVEEYACLYTSKVSNLLAYSPLQYYRSPRDLLPHEL